MKKDVRDYLKTQNGIAKTDSDRTRCKTCLFHSKEKVCQIHGIKTNIDEVCERHTTPHKRKVYHGGRMR